MEQELKARGAEVEFYDLSDQNISQCQGCCACYKKGFCHIKDDAEKISERIRKADGLILGSPTYASNVSGYMKKMIDRGHFVIEQLLTGKYCVTVATGENYGSKETSMILNNLVLYSGGRLTSKFVINVPFNSLRDLSVGLKAADKLYDSIRKKRRYPLQAISHKIIFSFGIRPFVLKKGDLYKGVRDRWNENNIFVS